ncbi:MAG TPA: glycosyltransferase family 4 protein [Candidatus Dormibacteraeota bacterium]|nr:glycosyltransferase family 4 protein [Candidatus Dormibacteraeota bacterium]
MAHQRPMKRGAGSKGRVLFLVENAPVPADRRVWNEAQTLAEAGFGVSIVCAKWGFPRYYEELEGIRIYRVPLPSLGGMAGHLVEYVIATPILFLYTCLVFFREGFDVIHAANPPDFLYAIARVFKVLGKKFVFDQHDVVPEACGTRWSGVKLRLTQAIARWTERASYRAADVVITTNESVRRLALERGGVAADRVFVVRNAIRRSHFHFHAARPRPELRRGRRHMVFYAGVIGPDDGLDQLVLAVHHIVTERGRRDIHFAVLGDGDCLPEIKQMSRRLGLQDEIEFTGWVKDDRVIGEYLATADVGVVPDPKSPVNDLCSMNKMVEYMALGKPVVAFDLTEAQETAQGAAVYVATNGRSDPAAFGDRILELLGSPETREAMGRIGRQRFGDVLAWEHQQANLLRAYETLLGRREAASASPAPDLVESTTT